MDIDPNKEKRRKLFQLMVARSDMQLALCAMEHFDALLPHLDVHPENMRAFRLYSSAFIVNYAKPFSTNYVIKALDPSYAAFSNPEFNARHKELIDRRNWVYAHSDGNKLRAFIGEDREYIAIEYDIPPLWMLKQWLAMVQDLIARIDSDIRPLRDELYGEELKGTERIEVVIDLD